MPGHRYKNLQTYRHSLDLLKQFRQQHPDIPAKSGIMVGLGETGEEILQVMRDMRAHDVNMLTIGRYLMPSGDHLPVRRAHGAGVVIALKNDSQEQNPAAC